MGLDAEPGPCIVLVADLDADVGVRDRGALVADREEGLVADAFMEGCALVADCGGLVLGSVDPIISMRAAWPYSANGMGTKIWSRFGNPNGTDLKPGRRQEVGLYTGQLLLI